MHLHARRWLYALLVVATLATQALGLVHQVLHDGAAAGRPATHGVLDDAFALDDEGVACELFDQLVQGGATPSPLLAFDFGAPHQPLPAALAGMPHGSAAAFQARAPPAA